MAQDTTMAGDATPDPVRRAGARTRTRTRATGREHLADRLEGLSDQLEMRAREVEAAGGVQAQTGQIIRMTGEAIDSGADYIRHHDVGEMRDDVEHAIRERPLMSIGIAIGVGYVLGKLFAD